ncbi:MAG TPA: hypothetical protein PKD92_01175 [Novosphingobium sp.]|nr:hypothetical protein [Novosphingobium sp.]
MKLVIFCLALLFSLFPYTQVIKLDSYTQPYALIFAGIASIVAFPMLLRSFPRGDAMALLALAVLGIILFLISCMPQPTGQEFKYVLIYVSPALFCFASYALIVEHPKLADRLVCGAALAWIGVGVAQVVIDPGFMTQLVGTFSEAAGDVVDSGRGTLGLAPEPTHFGFHMVIMAALLALIGGRNALAIACVVTAVLIARSSSALLALVLGGIIYMLVYTGKARLLLLAVFPAYVLLGAVLASGILPADMRVVALAREFYDDPFYLLTSDTSANMRLGGIVVGFKEIVGNAVLPFGMAHETWLDRIGPILSRNGWLLALSEAGVPSGILIVVFQAGIFGLVPLAWMIWRMLSRPRSHFEALLVSVMVFVFFSQYMISTPGFGLIYGAVLARRRWASRLKGGRSGERTPRPAGPAAPALA